MARIFVSYSRQDQAFARRLAASLSDMGADVWIDVEDIPVGMKWSSAIQQGLDTGQLLIVVISPDSMASRNVEDEWQYYLDQGKPVVPILLHPANIHFQLNRIQYIDFHQQDYATALHQLYGQLKSKGLALNAPRETSEVAKAMPDFDTMTPQQIEHWMEELRKRQLRHQTPMATPPPVRRGVPRGVLWAGVSLFALVVVLMLGITYVLPVILAVAYPNPTVSVTEAHVVDSTNTTPTPAQTAPIPPGMPGNPVTHNSAWSTLVRDFNGMEMVLVPAGSFVMGTPPDIMQWLYDSCVTILPNCRNNQLLDDEAPTTEVTFQRPFWIGRYEVTNVQAGSEGDHPGGAVPRTNLTWDQAQAVCEQYGLRLPTEAEWEYAARGPDSLTYPWGWEDDGTYSNYCDASCNGSVRYAAASDGFANPAPVGSFPQGVSWVGAEDMAGNVWEWTSTVYTSRPADGYEDPSDHTARRTLKGGSWNWILSEARPAARSPHANNNPGSPWYGFRCARDFAESDLS